MDRDTPDSGYTLESRKGVGASPVTSAVSLAISLWLDTCPAPLDFKGRCQRTQKTDRSLLGIISDDAESPGHGSSASGWFSKNFPVPGFVVPEPGITNSGYTFESGKGESLYGLCLSP